MKSTKTHLISYNYITEDLQRTEKQPESKQREEFLQAFEKTPRVEDENTYLLDIAKKWPEGIKITPFWISVGFAVLFLFLWIGLLSLPFLPLPFDRLSGLLAIAYLLVLFIIPFIGASFLSLERGWKKWAMMIVHLFLLFVFVSIFI